MGFSTALPELLYLPVDTDRSAPSVEGQESDPLSLLNTVKALLRLRNSEEDLQAKANLEIIHAPSADHEDRSFIFKRGSCVIAVNPRESIVNVNHDKLMVNKTPLLLYSKGDCSYENGLIRLGGQSFGVWKIGIK